MKTCADLILTMAIQDMAKEENISIAQAREKLICSPAYDALYDFDTELWQEGPDAFRYYYGQLKKRR